MNSNWSYSPETLKSGQNGHTFVLSDLDIWWMSLKNNSTPVLCYFNLCALFHSHHWNHTVVSVQKPPNRVKTNDFMPSVTLKLDTWPWKTMSHLFYATSSFVYHFVATGELKLELQSGYTQFGSKSVIFFVPSRLENLTLFVILIYMVCPKWVNGNFLLIKWPALKGRYLNCQADTFWEVKKSLIQSIEQRIAYFLACTNEVLMNGTSTEVLPLEFTWSISSTEQLTFFWPTIDFDTFQEGLGYLIALMNIIESCLLTHWGWVTHICVSKLYRHWFR